MARSVTYSVVPRINPTEKSAPPRYYAQAQARGDVSIREMAERIQVPTDYPSQSAADLAGIRQMCALDNVRITR